MAHEKAKAAVDAPATSGGAGAEAAREELPRPAHVTVTVYTHVAYVTATFEIGKCVLVLKAKAELDKEKVDSKYYLADRITDAIESIRFAVKWALEDMEYLAEKVAKRAGSVELDCTTIETIAERYARHDKVFETEITDVIVKMR